MEIGKRLIPVTIDAIAQAEPDRPWASVPENGLTDFVDIPFKTLANAINRKLEAFEPHVSVLFLTGQGTAWWIVNVVGRSKPGSFPTVTYLGPSDLRYYVMLIAIIKAGYKPLFISHLNSQAANSALYEKTSCHIILNAFVNVKPVDAVAGQQIQTFQVPTSDELWNPEPVEIFPFEKSFKDAINDPFVILHTSGSSGLPKPVIYTHGVMASADGLQLKKLAGSGLTSERRPEDKRAIIGFPPFHAGGMLTGFMQTVWYGNIIVFPPSSKPLDAQMFHEMLPSSGARGAMLLPRVLEQIGRMPDVLAAMKDQLYYVLWAGGPISTEAGDAISKVTTLVQHYASTEIGPMNDLRDKAPEDWNYIWFAPNQHGFDFRPLVPVKGEKQLYELFVKRDDRLSQQVFLIFRDLDEWPTNDLFSKHATRPDLWKHEGRSDDLIVSINANNLNPRPIEATLRKHPQIRDVLLVGTRRPRVCAIIEPVETVPPTEHDAFIETVMPFVAQSNATAPMHGQLQRELVIITDPALPFPRTGKGTVQRGAAAKLYACRIDDLYASLPNSLKDVRVERVQGASV